MNFEVKQLDSNSVKQIVPEEKKINSEETQNQVINLPEIEEKQEIEEMPDDIELDLPPMNAEQFKIKEQPVCKPNKLFGAPSNRNQPNQTKKNNNFQNYAILAMGLGLIVKLF